MMQKNMYENDKYNKTQTYISFVDFKHIQIFSAMFIHEKYYKSDI